MPRRRYIALVAGAAVVAGLALAWLNRPRDDPSRASVGDAVRSFRAGSDRGGVKVGLGEPEHGVYRYATRGSESAQTLLGGARHDYRGISTIVLSSGGCGELERWQVLASRWTEAESCPAPHGYELRALTEFHEFFGVEQEDSYRCQGAAIPGIRELRPGVRFSISCESEDASISSASRVVGFEPASVGAGSFPAIHIVLRSRLGGETSGAVRRDDWRRRSDGLLLRRSVSADADSSAGGGSHYTEHYALQLLDSEPRR